MTENDRNTYINERNKERKNVYFRITKNNRNIFHIIFKKISLFEFKSSQIPILLRIILFLINIQIVQKSWLLINYLNYHPSITFPEIDRSDGSP